MKKYSENELLKTAKEQVNCYNNLTLENGFVQDIFAGSFPCWIHINNFKTLALDYFNNAALQNFQESMDDIKKEGVNFLHRVIHEDTAKVAVPLLTNSIKSADFSKIIFFEQRIKYSLSENYKTHLSFSIMNKPLNSFITITFPVELLEKFVKKRLFQDTSTFEKCYEKFLSLSKREREILKYIVLGKTNNQIGELLNISVLTIKTHRQNIFQKLGTSNIAELTKIAVYFNIIDLS